MATKYRYSRIVRKITQMLAGRDVPTSFLDHHIDESGALVAHLVHLADVIEQALKGETIKKSEVDHLKRIEKDYYSNFDTSLQAENVNLREDVDTWHRWFTWSTDRRVEDQIKIHGLKDKLWAAEQEIHDLKHDLEFAQNLADDAIRSNTEQIDPPACLKPLDAMTWTTTYVYSGVTYPL